MLHSAASFSVYASGEGGRDGTVEKEIMMGIDSGDGCGLDRSATIGDGIEALTSCDSGEFSFRKVNSMDLLIEEEEEAIGLGLDGHGDGVAVAAAPSDTNEIEEYFKKMVTQNPSNSLFLRNYAHLLQSRGELERAEEYYLKATIADPGDPEILLLYAKLVWELHRHYRIASDYFQRAALAAPNDSNIQAEWARFLWEAGENEDEDETKQDLPLAARSEENLVADVENRGEEYSKKAIQANPRTNREEYFKKAIQADPHNSDTLAAYARFLWETDCHEDEESVP